MDHEPMEELLAELLSSPDHVWPQGLDAETKAKVRKFYKERYDQ